MSVTAPKVEHSPSRTESLPHSRQSSTSLKVAFVESCTAGPQEVVYRGRTGLPAPSGNPPALAEATIRLLENRNPGISRSHAGRQQAATLLSWEKVTRDVLQASLSPGLRDDRRGASFCPCSYPCPRVASDPYNPVQGKGP